MSYLKYDGTAATETAAPSTNFYGTPGVDTDNGTAANEAFWGQGGDLMTGGAGDDTYYLQDKADQVVEQPGGGTDELVAWANTSLLNYPNVENLSISGDGIYGAGNSADNVIYAGAGTEQIYGGGGQDVLVGGSGTDTFIVKAGEGNDAIYGFKPGSDVIRLSAGFSTFADVQSHMTQVGADVKIDFGGGEGVVIRNTQVGQLTAANFELNLDTSKLAGMTFHDEFSGPLSVWNATYNPTGTWRPDYGYQGSQGVGSYTLTGNGEQQIYTSPYYRDAAGDHASPFSSNADGTLSITAAPAPAGETDLFGYQYTSGMISTKESFAQTYGYFEMRAELPHSAGGWPAFWLVPADGSWPPELDVMETLTGDPNADYTTQHSQATGTHIATGISSYIPNTSDGFHTYGVLWTKTDLAWYVDGVEVFHTATPADMNKPMYMIANLALGGWSGTIDPATMPETMKIDYIRSYALADGSTTVQGFDSGHTTNDPYTTTISPPAASDGSATPPPVTTTPPPVTASPPPVTPPPPPASPPPVSPPADSSGAGQAIAAAGYGSTLTGTDGADTLTSHQGGDTMTGGAGDDLFVFTQTPWTPDHITDFQVGHDKLDISGLYVDGYHGTDPIADGYVTLVSDGNGGTSVIVDPDGHAAGHQWGDYVVDLQGVDPSTLNSANLFGTGAATTSPPPVTASPPPVSPPPAAGGGTTSTTVPGSVLTGHAGGDSLTGSAGDDTLTGLDGGNVLHGGDGNDSISGGSGFNQVNGNKGDDTIAGHSTVGDWLLGGQGNDLIDASGQNNILNGNIGNDTVVGGAGNDILHGGQGDDSIVAGSGSEWISGDKGDDTIQLGSGTYTIHGFVGTGIDTVLGFNASDHVQLDAGTSYTLSQSGADTIIDIQGGDELILKNTLLSSLPAGWVFTG